MVGGYVGGCGYVRGVRRELGGNLFGSGGCTLGGIRWRWGGGGGGGVVVSNSSKMLFLGTFWKITTYWPPLD